MLAPVRQQGRRLHTMPQRLPAGRYELSKWSSRLLLPLLLLHHLLLLQSLRR